MKRMKKFSKKTTNSCLCATHWILGKRIINKHKIIAVEKALENWRELFFYGLQENGKLKPVSALFSLPQIFTNKRPLWGLGTEIRKRFMTVYSSPKPTPPHVPASTQTYPGHHATHLLQGKKETRFIIRENMQLSVTLVIVKPEHGDRVTRQTNCPKELLKSLTDCLYVRPFIYLRNG